MWRVRPGMQRTLTVVIVCVSVFAVLIASPR